MANRGGLITAVFLAVVFGLLGFIVLPAAGMFGAPGKQVAAELGCVKCHGENGVSVKPYIPNLAGQPAPYLIGQLNLFLEPRGNFDVNRPRRHHQMMDAEARKLTAGQAKIIADYYESLPCPTGDSPKEDPYQLPRRFLKLCLECHDPSGNGFKKDMPVLYGQKRQYMMQAIHTLQRTPANPENNPSRLKERYNPTVKRLVVQLSPEKAGALVDYFASRTCRKD